MGLLEVITVPILIMVIKICVSGNQHVKPEVLSAYDEENANVLICLYEYV